MLIVAFVSGLAIGFLVCFAFFGLRGKSKEAKPLAAERVAAPIPETAPPPAAAPEVHPPAPAVTEPAASSAAPVTPPAPPEPAAPAPPPLPEFWPGRFLFVAISGATLNDKTAAFLKEVRPGGVLLGDDNLVNEAQTAELVHKIKEAVGQGTGLGDLPLIAVEQEGGKYNKLKLKAKDAPSAAELGKKKDPEAAREAGRNAANAALARGIGVVLAPVLDVIPPDMPKGEFVGRVFGGDPAVVTQIGLAFADGINDTGAISVCKYFPGIGTPKKKGAASFSSIDADAKQLAPRVFPFQEFASRNFPGVLVGYVAVPAVDVQFPERLAAFSPVIVGELLRDSYKYKGVVLADNIAAQKSVPADKAVVDALAAGCDGVLIENTDYEQVKSACAAIDKAVADDILKKEQLGHSVQRLDEWKIRLAVVKPPSEQPKPAPDEPAKADTKTEEAPAKAEKPAEKAASEKAPPPVPVEAKPVAEPKKTPADSEKIVHTIERGETLKKIANRYGVKVSDIQKWNNDISDETLKYGQTLVILKPAASEKETATEAPVRAENTQSTDAARTNSPDTTVYVIKKGDRAEKIAAKYGITVRKLEKLNHLEDVDELEAGQELIVPKLP